MINRYRFNCDCMILGVVVTSLLTTFSLSASAQANDRDEECTAAGNENIVFADLHLIQAINDLIDQNSSGALNQLALAQGELDKALSQE